MIYEMISLLKTWLTSHSLTRYVASLKTKNHKRNVKKSFSQKRKFSDTNSHLLRKEEVANVISKKIYISRKNKKRDRQLVIKQAKSLFTHNKTITNDKKCVINELISAGGLQFYPVFV